MEKRCAARGNHRRFGGTGAKGSSAASAGVKVGTSIFSYKNKDMATGKTDTLLGFSSKALLVLRQVLLCGQIVKPHLKANMLILMQQL